MLSGVLQATSSPVLLHAVVRCPMLLLQASHGLAAHNSLLLAAIHQANCSFCGAPPSYKIFTKAPPLSNDIRPASNIAVTCAVSSTRACSSAKSAGVASPLST